MIPGICVPDASPAVAYVETMTGKKFPDAVPSPTQNVRKIFTTNLRMTLLNGDPCALNQWVLIKPNNNIAPPLVACVREIVTMNDSEISGGLGQTAILCQLGNISGFSQRYNMPCISLSEQWAMHPLPIILVLPIRDCVKFLPGHSVYGQHPTQLSCSWLRAG